MFPVISLENYLRRLVNFPEVNEDDEERQAQLAAASLQSDKTYTDPSSDGEESEEQPKEGKEEPQDA